MAFEIPIDLDYFDHPKTLRLMEVLKRPEADVYPIRLWRWAAKYARAGVIPTDVSVMERGVRWKGKSGLLHAAMVEVGFIEKDGLTIHDWNQYVGRAIHIYEIKKRKQRERYDKREGILPEEFRKNDGRSPEEFRGNSGDIPPTPDAPDAPDAPEGIASPPAEAPSAPPSPASPATGPSAEASGGADDLTELRQAAKDAKLFVASDKQRDEVLASWLARDGKARVIERIRSSPGQDLLKAFTQAGKGPPPFRPKPREPQPCRKCDGTGKVVDHAKTTPTQTSLKSCEDCKGKGRAAS